MSVRILKSLSENKLPLAAMVERSIKGKYNSSIMGIAWNVVMPALLIFAIWLVFTQIKTYHTEPDFWLYLSIGIFAMTVCSNCLRGRVFYSNSTYVKKVAVPRWIEVLADVIAQFVTLIISYVLLIIVALAVGHPFDITIVVFLPVMVALLFVVCLGCSLFFSTLNVVSSDLGHFMTVVSRIAVWLTPVFFFMSDAKETLKAVASCNPFTYFVEPLHQTMYWGEVPDWGYMGLAVLIAFIAFAFGWVVFSHYEKRIAEML